MAKTARYFNSETSGYAMVIPRRPKPLKIEVFGGLPSPQGSHSPYILGDTTRPGHATCNKSDRRRLRKTLHKQTNRQTDRHYENNGNLAVNQQVETTFNNVKKWHFPTFSKIEFAINVNEHNILNIEHTAIILGSL